MSPLRPSGFAGQAAPGTITLDAAIAAMKATIERQITGDISDDERAYYELQLALVEPFERWSYNWFGRLSEVEYLGVVSQAVSTFAAKAVLNSSDPLIAVSLCVEAFADCLVRAKLEPHGAVEVPVHRGRA